MGEWREQRGEVVAAAVDPWLKAAAREREREGGGGGAPGVTGANMAVAGVGTEFFRSLRQRGLG